MPVSCVRKRLPQEMEQSFKDLVYNKVVLVMPRGKYPEKNVGEQVRVTKCLARLCLNVWLGSWDHFRNSIPLFRSGLFNRYGYLYRSSG